MTLLHPAMLFGLLAVSLPVAIHLLSKPRVKRMAWAATRFLLASLQKNKRRLQAEDLVLLLLRALLVALLALLFARPAFLTDAGQQLGGLAAPAVILLDNSMSMGQSDGVKTRFDQAKSMANDLLSKLSPGSACALYLVSNQVKAVVPKPTKDFPVLRRSIEQAPLTDGGSDLYPGLKMAVDLLKSLPGSHREIFILTDGQSAALREVGKIRDLQQQNAKDIVIRFLVVGDKGEDNLAVSGLEVASTSAAVGQPIRCAVTVSNWGSTAAQKIPVKLAVDSEAPQDEGLIDRIEPGASKVVTLVAHFRKSGYHSLTATIPGDRLPADNQRSVALLVLEQINALVVEGTIKSDPAEADGFFLKHALVPVSPELAAQYYVKVKTAPPQELEESNISQDQLIFLSNVGPLTPRATQNLRDYVNRGGALILFPGPDTDVNFDNGDSVFSPLLPAKLGPPQGPPAGQSYLGWQSKSYEHPLVTLWNNPDSGSLGNVRAFKYFPLGVKPAPGGATAGAPQVVVRYSNSEPAVVEQSVGKGRVILFSSGATTDWTTLPIHPAFVPLLIRIISFVTNGLGGGLNLAPGQPFATTVDSELAGKDFSVLRPGEKKPRLVGEVEAGEQAAVLRYADTGQSGPYEIFVGEDARPRAVFAVRGDPDESNLAQLPKADLQSLAESAQPGNDEKTPAATDQPALHPRVPGQELWFPLAIGAILLALLEMALAHRISESR